LASCKCLRSDLEALHRIVNGLACAGRLDDIEKIFRFMKIGRLFESAPQFLLGAGEIAVVQKFQSPAQSFVRCNVGLWFLFLERQATLLDLL
jgi:hypothetical protein